MKPIIQFDRLMGVKPQWRKAITEGLKGHPALVERTFLSLTGWAPSSARLFEAAYHYAQCGQQVYCLGPKLLEMLRATSTTHIPNDALKFPYDCFYVAFQDSPWKLWGDMQTGFHKLSGAYVYKRGNQVTFVLWGPENEHSKVAGDDASFWVDLYLNRLPERSPGVVDLEAYLGSVFGNKDRDFSDPGVKMPRSHGKEVLASVTEAIQVIFNMLLYVTSLDAELKRQAPNKGAQNNLKKKLAKTSKPKKKRQLQAQLAQHTEATVIWIGGTIEKEALPEKTGGGGGGGSGTWAYRKGHFHWYWTGPRTADDGSPQKGTKRIHKWVKPIRRDMVAVVQSRGRHHKFIKDKK